MKKLNQKTELEAKIAFLKLKQQDDLEALKVQYDVTIDSLKPINIIKKATLNFISSPDLKSNLINGAIGIGTNYLSKNLLNENSANPVKRVLGKVLKFALKNFIGKNRRKSSDID
jgi:hypothetical protein